MHLLLYIKTHVLAHQHWEAIGVKQWLCTNHTNIDYSLIFFLFFCQQNKIQHYLGKTFYTWWMKLKWKINPVLTDNWTAAVLVFGPLHVNPKTQIRYNKLPTAFSWEGWSEITTTANNFRLTEKQESTYPSASIFFLFSMIWNRQSVTVTFIHHLVLNKSKTNTV